MLPPRCGPSIHMHVSGKLARRVQITGPSHQLCHSRGRIVDRPAWQLTTGIAAFCRAARARLSNWRQSSVRSRTTCLDTLPEQERPNEAAPFQAPASLPTNFSISCAAVPRRADDLPPSRNASATQPCLRWQGESASFEILNTAHRTHPQP